jgi:hypothetical protein
MEWTKSRDRKPVQYARIIGWHKDGHWLQISYRPDIKKDNNHWQTISGKMLCDEEITHWCDPVYDMPKEVIKDSFHLEMENWPKAKELYKHYKGGQYEIISCAPMESDGTPIVIYESLQNKTQWARTLSNFTELVNDIPRFMKVD